MARARIIVLALIALAQGCAPASPPAASPSGSEGAWSGVRKAPAAESAASSQDAPQISRSTGVEGGIVVLWPRIVGPRDGVTAATDVARALQTRLAAVAKRVAKDRPIDVRPEPERVCPRSGCAAVSLGVLLAVAGKGCAAVALVSDKGPSPANLVSWGGVVELRSTTVPFREPPEGSVGVSDYVPCDSLLESLNDGALEAAIAQKLR